MSDSPLTGIWGVEQDIAKLRESLMASASAVTTRMEALCKALESRDTSEAMISFDAARASIALANVQLGRWSQFVEWSARQRGMADVQMMRAEGVTFTEEDMGHGEGR